MCYIIETVLAIAATAASVAAQKQQADAQAKYQSDMYQQAAKRSLDNFIQQTGMVGVRMGQNAASAAANLTANQMQVGQAIGHAQAAAAESGVGGNSVSALFNSFQQIGATNADATQTSLQFQNEQLIQDERSLRAQAQNRIAGSIPGPVNQPNYLGAALQLGSSLYGQYDKYSSRNQSGIYNPSNYMAGFNIPSSNHGPSSWSNVSSG